MGNECIRQVSDCDGCEAMNAEGSTVVDVSRSDVVGRSPHAGGHQPPHQLAAFFVSSLTDVCIAPPMISVRCTTIPIDGYRVYSAFSHETMYNILDLF